LGQILLTIHNITFMIEFMKKVREAIKMESFKEFKERYMKVFSREVG